MKKKIKLFIVGIIFFLVTGILVSVNCNSPANTDYSKYDNKGILDTSFGSNGVAAHDNAAGGNDTDRGYAVAVDENNNLVVVGSSYGITTDMAIWRYTGSGVLDTGFGGGDGYDIQINANGGTDGTDIGYDVVIDEYGNIYVAGCSTNGINQDIAIWKYSSNGTLDTSFGGGNGFVTADIAGGDDNDMLTGICIDETGDIIMVGQQFKTSYDMIIVKYDSTGNPVTGFGTSGVAVYNNGSDSETAEDVIIDSNGNILVSGTTQQGLDNIMTVWRYTNSGVLDTGFGTGGMVKASLTGISSGQTLVIDDNNRIVVVGANRPVSDHNLAIWCFSIDGDVDTSFGTNGIALWDNPDTTDKNDFGYDIVIDNFGRYVVCGYSENSLNDDIALWRYTTDGTVDTTFASPTGYTVLDQATSRAPANQDVASGVTTGQNNMIYITGISDDGTGNDNMVLVKYK